MKKILIIPILLMLLVSCSKNSSNLPIDYTNNNPQLIGKWNYTALYGYSFNTNTVAWHNTPTALVSTIQFNLDGTYVYNDLSGTVTGSYNVSSSNVIVIKNLQSAVSVNLVATKQIQTITSSELIMDPIPECVEGCREKYAKITTP